MPRRRRPGVERPPEPPDEDGLTPSSKAYALLYPTTSKPICEICRMEVLEIRRHLALDHDTITAEEYFLTYPGAKTKASAEPKVYDVVPRVSAKEAQEHPGGRDGAQIEKSLAAGERGQYREIVDYLASQGFLGHQVAGLAYKMLLAARLRLQIEADRRKTGGHVASTVDLDQLDHLDAAIGTAHKDLEKLKATRKEQNPVEFFEKEQAAAELWVRSKQGEQQERCSGCGLILTPNGLPHWAYAPIQTPNGVEYPVWSPELWRLVLARQLPLWAMAYVLRTSPEGLRVVAKRRRESWPTWVVLELEERELRKILDLQDLEATIASQTKSEEESR